MPKLEPISMLANNLLALSNTWGQPQSMPVRDTGGAVTNVMAAPYGAKGDGATLEDAAIAAAITAAGVGGTVLFPPGKTFLISSPIKPLAGQTIWGYGAIIKRCNVVSAATTGAVTITSGASVPTLTLTSTAGLVPGMAVGLWTDSTHFDTIVHTLLTVGGGQVTMSGNAAFTWTGVVTVFTAFGLIEISNPDVTVLGVETNGNQANNALFQWWTLQQEIHINGADRVIIRDCYLHDGAAEGIEIIGADTLIEGNIILNMQGNGIHLSNPSSGYFRVLGNHVENVNLSGTATGHADGCIIASNPVIDTIIANNVCINGIAGIGSWDSDDNYSLTCVGNIIKNCTSFALDMVSPGVSPGKVIFSKNLIYNSGLISVNLTSGAAPTGPFNISIEGNYIEDTVLVLNGVQNMQVSGNIIKNSAFTSVLIALSNTQHLSIVGNRLIQGLGGVFSTGAATVDLLISDNAFVDNLNYAVSLDVSIGGPNIKLQGNMCTATAGTVAAGHTTFILNCNYAAAIGNTINNQASGGFGISAAGGLVSTPGNLLAFNTIHMVSGARTAIQVTAAAFNAILVANIYTGVITDVGTATALQTQIKEVGGADPIRNLSLSPTAGTALTITPAANAVGINVGTSGSASCIIGLAGTGIAGFFQTAGASGAVRAVVADAATNTQALGVQIYHQSSGTPAGSFGGQLGFNADSATVASRVQGNISALWTTATDASRAARMAFFVADFTATREVIRIEADGAAARLGFYGVAAVVRAAAITTPNAQTASYVQADVTSLKTAIDAIRVALTNVGITA